MRVESGPQDLLPSLTSSPTAQYYFTSTTFCFVIFPSSYLSSRMYTASELFSSPRSQTKIILFKIDFGPAVASRRDKGYTSDQTIGASVQGVYCLAKHNFSLGDGLSTALPTLNIKLFPTFSCAHVHSLEYRI